MVARGRQQSQTKGRRGRSKSKGRAVAKDECAFCHEKGHWKKDSPKLQKKGKAPQDANVAECKSDVESDISLIVSLLASSYLDEWILDSDCTYHMFPFEIGSLNFKNLMVGLFTWVMIIHVRQL